MGTGTTGISRHPDFEAEVGMDRTHPQETNRQHHTTSPILEPAGEEEERQAAKQLEEGHRSRAQTAVGKLEWSSPGSPEQSALAWGRRWPMLVHELWA